MKKLITPTLQINFKIENSTSKYEEFMIKNWTRKVQRKPAKKINVINHNTVLLISII